MTKRLRWTEEAIENELRQYRANKCRAEELRIDLEAAREYLAEDRDGSIEASALHHPQEPDAGRGNAVSDATARIAIKLPDEEYVREVSAELAQLDRRVRRVNAWLGALSNREKMIVTLYYIDGMVWGEVVYAYNSKPTDGKTREEITLKRWRVDALQRIKKVSNS